jgi:nucleoside-diphosphate-sugar epimerase
LKLRPKLSLIFRVISDIFLINFALFLAFVLRFLALFALGYYHQLANASLSVYNQVFFNSIRIYIPYALLITAIGLIVFAASGFYTQGAYYRRHKTLVIFGAVSLSYLIFLSVVYILNIVEHYFPRPLFLLGWLLTFLFIWGARFTKTLLATTGVIEPELLKQKKDTVEKVLLVGGAGYVGSLLSQKLLQKGYKVRVLDSLLYGEEPIKKFLANPSFELIKGDIRNIEILVRSLQDVDAVIHLGALVGDPACELDEDLTMEINLAATRLLAEVAKGYGIDKFIYASTCSVYGASEGIVDEESPIHPVSLYARTKAESEKILLSLRDERFSPVIFRLATLYGFSLRPRFDLVVNLLTAKAVTEGKITIFGGDQWRPFIHVDDAARVFVEALEQYDKVSGKVFNVGFDDENYTILQVGEIIKEVIPSVEVKVEGEGRESATYQVSFNKIRNKLNFVKGKTLREGILEIKRALESGLVPDYTSARYSNIKYLSESMEGFKTEESKEYLETFTKKFIKNEGE